MLNRMRWSLKISIALHRRSRAAKKRGRRNGGTYRTQYREHDSPPIFCRPETEDSETALRILVPTLFKML
jgi:hypothetical protein